jgi:formylglycine-generating enzyme required for sulfatase activity
VSGNRRLDVLRFAADPISFGRFAMHALIPAPSDPAQWQAWCETLHQWRNSTRALLGTDDSLYRQPEFAWVPRTFTLALVMMNDLLFYDGDYRLDEFLQHGIREFGGYDALILWHAYPRIGFDERNQFDFYRQMPGGLERLRALVDACHARDVRVYVDYNPWDTGTRREDKSDIDALVDLVRALDADAIFLDTMANAAQGLREKLDVVRPGVTLESEVLVPMEHIGTHPSSWAQSFVDVPGVLRNKWYERRHMQHRIRRWQQEHTPELHTAWLNGTGMVVWENVFGFLNGWNERDKSILRSMVGVQHRYHALFSGEGWTPLVETLNPSVYASLWEGEGLRLWTLANSSESDASGALIEVPHRGGDRYYDLIRGVELLPKVSEGLAHLNSAIRGRGVGAFLATSETSDDFRTFLSAQAELAARANFDATPPSSSQTLHPLPQTEHYAEVPANMVAIPTQQFDMPVTFSVRECGFYDVPDMIFPRLNYANLHRLFSFTRPAQVAPYAIDLTPITNRQFAEFLAASGYMPEHGDNFLAHWQSGEVPPGLEEHPVVYVALEDARAYAAWAGKRLPSEEEWQFAAQGYEALHYPWGNDWQPDRCNNGQFGTTTPVMRFPQGRSPFGIDDLCGNVWEWTESERTDQIANTSRTRFSILKGGSYYRAYGSEWYADGGAQSNDFAAKFLHMSPGLDRCATIGFRCAVDLA